MGNTKEQLEGTQVHVHVGRHLPVQLFIKLRLILSSRAEVMAAAAAASPPARSPLRRGFFDSEGERSRKEGKGICSLCLHCRQPSSQRRQSSSPASTASPGEAGEQAEKNRSFAAPPKIPRFRDNRNKSKPGAFPQMLLEAIARRAETCSPQTSVFKDTYAGIAARPWNAHNCGTFSNLKIPTPQNSDSASTMP